MLGQIQNGWKKLPRNCPACDANRLRNFRKIQSKAFVTSALTFARHMRTLAQRAPIKCVCGLRNSRVKKKVSRVSQSCLTMWFESTNMDYCVLILFNCKKFFVFLYFFICSIRLYSSKKNLFSSSSNDPNSPYSKWSLENRFESFASVYQTLFSIDRWPLCRRSGPRCGVPTRRAPRCTPAGAGTAAASWRRRRGAPLGASVVHSIMRIC